jgi:hypothetical protein
VVVDGSCWLLLFTVVGCCCQLLLLVAVVGCWLLLSVAVVGCFCWLLLVKLLVAIIAMSSCTRVSNNCCQYG